MTDQTHMRRDVAQTPEVGARFLNEGASVPFAATGHPITDPLALIVSFYGFIEALSRHRGFNSDLPKALKKVTETV